MGVAISAGSRIDVATWKEERLKEMMIVAVDQGYLSIAAA